MIRGLTIAVVAGGLALGSAAAVQAQDEWDLAQDCVEALENVPGQ